MSDVACTVHTLDAGAVYIVVHSDLFFAWSKGADHVRLLPVPAVVDKVRVRPLFAKAVPVVVMRLARGLGRCAPPRRARQRDAGSGRR